MMKEERASGSMVADPTSTRAPTKAGALTGKGLFITHGLLGRFFPSPLHTAAGKRGKNTAMNQFIPWRWYQIHNNRLQSQYGQAEDDPQRQQRSPDAQ